MNQEFDLDEFEQLLKNQTDKHRMYPDDAVWRNINNSLHSKSRWPALTFSAILTVAVLTAGFIFLHPKKDLFNHQDPLVDNYNVQKIDNIAPVKHHTKSNVSRGLKPMDDKLVIYSINGLANQSDDDNTVNEMEGKFNFNSGNNVVVSLNEPINNIPVASQISSKILTANRLNAYKIDNNLVKTIATNLLNAQLPTAFSVQHLPVAITEKPNVKIENSGEGKEDNLNVQADDSVKNAAAPILKKVKEKIENPWEISFYATPSISYRTLSLDPTYDSHYPYNSALTGNPRTDVNNFVSQRPAIGLEFGASLLYSINNKFKVKAGLQFNYRQYNFNAYLTPTQQASLLLNRGTYADSMITFSNISTQGINAVSIGNYSYQLSLPIGFEYTAIQGKKVDIAVGATLQPTYQFNKDMYMVTSDYKAYTIEPSLARRWNINTGVELMARFKAAGLQWQAGPQLRYQMMPTQINSYIIHEHLIDYGLKIGIIKLLK